MAGTYEKKIRFCMMNILVIALLASLVGCGSESSSSQNTADDTELAQDAESITSEPGGTVYCSDPNRLVLFYQDAEVSGDYTLVGTFDYTEEFVTAVEENPVLEGWGNKIIIVSASE